MDYLVFMDSLIQIPNGTYNLNMQVNDPNTFLLFVGTIVLAVATCFIAYFTFHYNRKSHDFIKKEFHEKMKPLLAIEHVRFTKDESDDSTYYFAYDVKNNGMSSARNIRIRYNTTNNTQINQIIPEFGLNDGGTSVGTIPPTGNKGFFRTLKPDGAFYVSIWFDYDYLDDQKNQCLIILGIITNREIPTEMWYYDHYDIIEAQEWNKDGMSGKRNAPT